MIHVEGEPSPDFKVDYNEHYAQVISPRLILTLGQSPIVPLVQLRGTGWYGLPGGRLKEDELDGNLLNMGTFPGLARELQEETGVDITPLASQTQFFGLAEYTVVNSVACTATEYTTPIFFANVPQGSNIEGDLTSNQALAFYDCKKNACAFPLFPDARICLSMLTARKGPLGGFLTDRDTQIYFQTKPTPRLLFQKPAWLRLES